MDDTLSIIKKGQASNLTDHLNTIDKTNSIKFTHEEDLEGKMPFLDTLIQIEEGGEVKNYSLQEKDTH